MDLELKKLISKLKLPEEIKKTPYSYWKRRQ